MLAFPAANVRARTVARPAKSLTVSAPLWRCYKAAAQPTSRSDFISVADRAMSQYQIFTYVKDVTEQRHNLQDKLTEQRNKELLDPIRSLQCVHVDSRYRDIGLFEFIVVFKYFPAILRFFLHSHSCFRWIGMHAETLPWQLPSCRRRWAPTCGH